MKKNMKIRRMAACTSFFLALVGLAGCGAVDMDVQSSTEKEVSAPESEEALFALIPESYSGQINDVNFNLTVEYPEDLDQIVSCTAEKQWEGSADIVVPLFGKDISEEIRDSGVDANGNRFDCYYGTFSDGSRLNLGNGMTYITSLYDKVMNAFRIQETEDYNADRYLTNQEFTFLSAEDAYQICVEQINSCGYDLGDTGYVYYSLDPDTMNQEEEIRDDSGNLLEGEHSQWDDSDACYYFFANQTFQDIPVYYGSSLFPSDTELEGKPVQAVYSMEGIQYLSVHNVYSCTETGEKITLAPFEDVLQCIAEKYGDILTGAEYKVTRAKLYWAPQDDGDEMKLV